MLSKRKISLFKSVGRFVSRKAISLAAKVVDRYVPDSLLLLFMNILDKCVPPKAIDRVINELDKLPHKVRSSLIAAADEYIPDTAANSRKISAVIAGIYKYVPDRIIPSKSLDSWSNLKMKFHIPTLLSREEGKSRKD